MATKLRTSRSNAYESDSLDETNRHLLTELQANARVPFAELGRRVGLSAPAVAERVGRLEQTGVITGYHAEVDPKELGFAIAAVVRVRPATQQLRKIPDLAVETPEVVECHRITGEDCFFLKLHLRSIDDLEDVLDRFTPFGQTTTSIIHSSPVVRRPLPISTRRGDQAAIPPADSGLRQPGRARAGGAHAARAGPS